jgi:hypothetical protein
MMEIIEMKILIKIYISTEIGEKVNIHDYSMGNTNQNSEIDSLKRERDKNFDQ